MTRPATVYDTPQYQLLPDAQGARFYANVDNRLEVTMRGKSFMVAVAVPTELFTYMREVARVGPRSSVLLAIDQVGAEGDFFLYSMMCGDKLHDLWVYTAAGFPAWMRDPAYHLKE